ncbi:MAG TPA: FprA family A-type flavoprotein [Candidatus Fimimorpha faecalis]|uniref:FprA family A-type flavoprotein n=1 Tax=Candidatus Fimimorpha faecalis TaxID=2840824 RepID=A0A9D1JCK0_9FIRM|nr:FprA family A-type flavoprotein [Candidatus Fimimorpha faecalis]
MYCTRKVTDTIWWVGGNDRRLALFENLFPIPHGVSYNSYVIMDEKTALMDTTDPSITSLFLANVAHTLNGRKLDYLIINHMEPDHCSNIEEIMHRHPETTLVCNAKTLQMIGQFYDLDLTERTMIIKEGDTLSLGSHTLHFVAAPMVHWPEVMMVYEDSEKILFSADGFGSFGALNGNLFNDEINFDRDWLDDARRYYTNIVGKYGAQVQAVLKKASGLDIQMICPLHGPIWRNNLAYILDKYVKWSTYEPEDKAVAIMYGSMYGNTERAADILATALSTAGVKDVRVYDISNTDVSELISEAFRCSHIVIASPTYNGGLYPVVESLLNDMKALNLQNRTFALIENGTWAATSNKHMRAIVETMKNMTILDTTVTVKSSVKEAQIEALQQLAKEIIDSLNQ